jgi:hypothetical protein
MVTMQDLAIRHITDAGELDVRHRTISSPQSLHLQTQIGHFVTHGTTFDQHLPRHCIVGLAVWNSIQQPLLASLSADSIIWQIFLLHLYNGGVGSNIRPRRAAVLYTYSFWADLKSYLFRWRKTLNEDKSWEAFFVLFSFWHRAEAAMDMQPASCMYMDNGLIHFVGRTWEGIGRICCHA